MKIKQNDPPREFEVGFGPKIVMKDCAHLELEADEQITFKTPSGGQYDVARKNWGFYATPSINGRLKRFSLRTVLVKNRLGNFFVMIVESGCEKQFDSYLEDEGLEVCGWLDDDQVLAKIDRALNTSVSAIIS